MHPYIHLAGKGTLLHFHHGNGFHGGVYQSILNELNLHQFDVYALKGRATWDKGLPQHRNLHLLANDLIEFVEHFNKAIIGVGHSLGASITVLAAIKRPELFKAVVLIEPAMVSYPQLLLLKYMPKKLVARLNIIAATLNKKDHWASREEYLSYIKRFSAYAQFSENTFKAFSQQAIKKHGDSGFNLSFPKRWEAHNYRLAPYLIPQLKKLDQLAVPTVAIRGNDNSLFPMRFWNRWKRIQSQAVFLQDDRFTHLLPLENAKACTSLISQGLKELIV